MDTYNMELDSIMESFNMDMFIIEHENFMNIMYSRHNNILNESVLHEGFKEKVKEVVDRARKAIKKLIDKIKEFFNNLKEKIKNKAKEKFDEDLKKYATDVERLKNIPPDVELHPVYDTKSIKAIISKLENNFNLISSDADKIKSLGKFSPENLEKQIEDIKSIDYELNNAGTEFQSDISNGNYTGKYTGYKGSEITSQILIEYLKLKDKLDDMNAFRLGNKLINQLKQADAFVGQFGQKYTYTKFIHDKKYNFSASTSDKIETDEYTDNSRGDVFMKFINKYIALYANLCRFTISNCTIAEKTWSNIFKFTHQIWELTSD